MSFNYTGLHAHYHAHRLTLLGTDDEAFNRSLSSARVEMNPHQVNAALFALRSPLSKGVLLGDEVGLGKTIEAGLVISQKWAERKRHILLIVPASLRKQWEQELWEKFSIHSLILEAATYKERKKAGVKAPFEFSDGVVITSYEFAARNADELKRTRWDLVVFDEAHRLRNVYKKGGSQRAKDLKAALADNFKILLTATPLQNSLMELFGIVSIIDDSYFGGEHAFRALYTGTGSTPGSLDDLRQRLKPVCHRTLRRQVQEAGHINFRKREARTFSFEPKDLEVELYTRLSAFLQRKDTISYGAKPNQLVILQARKILGSSTFAISKYLEALIGRLVRKQRAAVDMVDDIEDIGAELEETQSLSTFGNAPWADSPDEDDDADDVDEIDPRKLAEEIAELRDLLVLAVSIGSNAKGEKLIAQLPEILDQIEAKGGQRKAVIFTESVRTQRYLAELLSANGYAGQVVLMNGSNSDDESKRVYADWKARHAGTDKISGSRTADMKAAIVEAFKGPDKTILIATESGAEGINLQFCSLLINYDLPWNPQRVEQRIGRCHRYGQKIDVTVVNMLNLKNQAEHRIHQLLNEKFHLFDGVFGASDEVLGTLMNGIDFEHEVVRIVQNCRTEAEAEAEFDELTARIQDQIDQTIAAARSQVLENLDADVVSLLHRRNEALANALPVYKQRLLMVAKAEAPDALFPEPGADRFQLAGKTYTVAWPVADENDWQFFRVNDGLGSELVERAKGRDHKTDLPELVFEPSAYPFPGQLTAVQELAGQSGWMRVEKAHVPTGDTAREELLISCLTDDGRLIDADVADRMFMAPASRMAPAAYPAPEAELARHAAAVAEAFGERVKAENFEWVEAETERLDRYAADVEIEVDAQIKAIEAEVKELQKQKRSPDLGMDAKLSLSRQIKKLEGEVDDLKFTKFERRKQARKEVADKLDAFADSLNQAVKIEPLFTLRWSVR
jgi:superfamily II DNA or RNA helicase